MLQFIMSSWADFFSAFLLIIKVMADLLYHNDSKVTRSQDAGTTVSK